MSQFQRQLEELDQQFTTQINQIHERLDSLQQDLQQVDSEGLNKLLTQIYHAQKSINDLQNGLST